MLDATGLVTSHSDGVIRGWLDASRSDYVDDNGKPAALWHVYLATGELAGDEIDLELHEVIDSLVPATPTADAAAARRRQEEADAALARALAEADADAPAGTGAGAAQAAESETRARETPEPTGGPMVSSRGARHPSGPGRAREQVGGDRQAAPRQNGQRRQKLLVLAIAPGTQEELLLQSRSPRGVLPPLPSPPPAHLPHIGCRQAGWVAACTELLAVVEAKSGINGMRDRLRSAGFRCGKPVAGKTYFDIAVPLDVSLLLRRRRQELRREPGRAAVEAPAREVPRGLPGARPRGGLVPHGGGAGGRRGRGRAARRGRRPGLAPAVRPPAAAPPEVPRTSPSPAPTSEPPSPPENDEPKRRRAAPGLSYAEYDDDVDMDRPPTPAEDVDLARAIAASKADMARRRRHHRTRRRRPRSSASRGRRAGAGAGAGARVPRGLLRRVRTDGAGGRRVRARLMALWRVVRVSHRLQNPSFLLVSYMTLANSARECECRADTLYTSLCVG